MATAPRLSVRPADPADGTAIGEAQAAAWAHGYRELFDSEFLGRAVEGRRAGWPLAIEGVLAQDCVLLAGELDGDVVAFAHAGPAREEPSVGEIYGFYSHPNAWGTGLASLLMDEACVLLAERWDRVVLWTHREAGRARRFYEKSGFQTTGRQRVETLSDWTSEATVPAPSIEYTRGLADARRVAR